MMSAAQEPKKKPHRCLCVPLSFLGSSTVCFQASPCRKEAATLPRGAPVEKALQPQAGKTRLQSTSQTSVAVFSRTSSFMSSSGLLDRLLNCHSSLSGLLILLKASLLSPFLCSGEKHAVSNEFGFCFQVLTGLGCAVTLQDHTRPPYQGDIASLQLLENKLNQIRHNKCALYPDGNSNLTISSRFIASFSSRTTSLLSW